MKSFEKLLNFLIALTVVIIGASFFYFKQQKQSIEAKDRVALQSEVDKVVNKYLQQTNQAKNNEKTRLDRAQFEASKKVLSDRENARLENETKVNQSTSSTQIASAAEIKKRLEKYGDNPNIKDRVYDDGYGIEHMTPEEKKEYKRQYIENAKNGGYLIELDDDLQIIKSTPIRKPSKEEDVGASSPTD